MVVAATGFFDGVHLGHAKVIELLCATAKAEGATSAVITFWPHPRSILRQDAGKLRLLNSLEEKEQRLKALGVDEVHVVDFTREFSKMTAEEFIRDFLIKKFGVSTLIVGYDHRLGCKKTGSDDIVRIADKCGIKAVRVGAISDSYNTISSTYIRNLIETGGIERANALLGYEYTLKGVVVPGCGNGRKIGFRTANMSLYDPLKLIPYNGVYAVWATVEGKTYKGVCNIGYRPTVDDGRGLTVETHLLDFDDDIYGLDLTVRFVEFIREEQKFASMELLHEQLLKDAAEASEILK
ncbi:MAG: bifunctional riboflavin kinase/FAD synthetase [Bacteroidales bacterium]|nr:bifunctional riboflavin kinase/FAD synthetase [Bacteroidales bacterium]